MTLYRTKATNAEAKLHATALRNYEKWNKNCVEIMKRMGDGPDTLTMLIRSLAVGIHSLETRRPNETHSFNFWKFQPLISKDYLAILKCRLFLLYFVRRACFMRRKWTNPKTLKILLVFRRHGMRKRKCKKCAPVQINKRIINSVKYDGVVVVKANGSAQRCQV